MWIPHKVVSTSRTTYEPGFKMKHGIKYNFNKKLIKIMKYIFMRQ